MGKNDHDASIERSDKRNAVRRRVRLTSAQQALERLRGRGKIPESDRSVMAQNLGKMIAGAQQKDPALNFRRLFNEAFGEQRGENFLKKKERLISMPGQMPAEKHYTQGSHYLELLKTLVKYIGLPSEQSDEEQYTLAVMRLIEGTRYDYIGGYVDRAEVEYKKELDKGFEKLAETVESQVNLDWMREWVIDHPVRIEGHSGEVGRINFTTETAYYNGTCLDINQRVYSCLAPCVRIASLYSKHEVQKYIGVYVDNDASTTTPLDILKAIEHLIAKPGGLEDSGTEEFDENYNKFLQLESWQECPGDQGFTGVLLQTVFDIELRYDQDLAKWRPMMSLRQRYCNGHSYGDPLPQVYSLTGKKVFQIYFEYGSPNTLFAVEHTIEEGRVNYIVFEDREWFFQDISTGQFTLNRDLEEDLIEEGGLQFSPAESGFYDLLLASCFNTQENNEDMVNHLDCGDDPARYVRAPVHTLAACLMRNMAYAPEEKRIDQLLLKDAKDKYAKVKALSEMGEAEYDEAIGKL